MLSGKSFAVIFAFSMALPLVVDSHSWVDCMDWRFNSGKQSFDDNAGTCFGYARRFPVVYKGGKISPKYAFGSLDDTEASRHYKQSEEHPDDWPACSLGHKYKDGENEEVGADETRANPVDNAYGQNKWGPMTIAKPGQQLCVRWPAKNHQHEPNNIVYINMSPAPTSQDPTQRQLNQWTIAKLQYGNCFSGGSDKARCGGCFTIPQNRAPGDYLIQWRWRLIGSDNIPEWYTSCSDVRLGNGEGRGNTTIPAQPNSPSKTSGSKKNTKPTTKKTTSTRKKHTPTHKSKGHHKLQKKKTHKKSNH
ncbi:hypothetical protein K493DRAFT_332706 [Basidiobolus meristosporus CBS 931.73]|uniref:Chitin-binding type-4 domain-containing protein n=1 Tax=Basidiobolus meristosporus CBS 931.73 TaxID=1314790 RepID=A0A1Y1ZBL4_9FUNG|nr:hypothetical protein K493DRAFT_332706 [Basidiobolus meristosporus CBS 931.73]|eukprot:ORY07639.1 hypothetical protein K493DRAFT_332706 [Basidiobolus meristosporus CBS 931.73]